MPGATGPTPTDRADSGAHPKSTMLQDWPAEKVERTSDSALVPHGRWVRRNARSPRWQRTTS